MTGANSPTQSQNSPMGAGSGGGGTSSGSFYDTATAGSLVSEDKKPNINYTCKKCALVFQRYYELIRHQKNHCFKEENNKRSAKAQIAAAQIAQSLSSEDSNSSMDVHGGQQPGNVMGLMMGALSPSQQQHQQQHQLQSPAMHQQQRGGDSNHSAEHDSPQKFECDKCSLSFNRFDQFKEHQLIHLMNPNIFGQHNQQQQQSQQYGQHTPFGILQNTGGGSIGGSTAGSPTPSLSGGGFPNNMDNSMDLSTKNSYNKKRKFSESSDHSEPSSQSSPLDTAKKLKSDQLDFLYGYYLANEAAVDGNNAPKKMSYDYDTLQQFYQVTELKKRTNYDYLCAYFGQHDAAAAADLAAADTKPTFEFLIQFYQLNESKKFFQLDAVPLKPAPAPSSAVVEQRVGGPQTPTTPTPAAAPTGHNHKINNSNNNSDSSNQIHPNNLLLALREVATAPHLHPATNPAQQLPAQPITGGSEVAQQQQLSAAEKQNNKRLRTTILPEQLNFLYECYQNESNPSRKMLEEISKKVNLKKRVVQVSLIG